MSLTLGKTIKLSQEGKFRVERLLGSGGFGKVFQVTRVKRRAETQEEFALKEIECIDESAITKALKEAQTLSKVKHENIVQLNNCDYKGRKGRKSSLVFILTEYCSGGDLNFRLRQKTHSSQKLKWVYQLTSAIAYLHSLQPMIVHRDLKPANVLLTDNDNIKVADFGLARQYEALKQINSSESWYSYYMNSKVGTRFYMAPEVMDNHYTEKSDIFSLGIVFYAILEEKYFPLSSSSASRVYGAFVKPNGTTPIGTAMYYRTGNSDPREELTFLSTYKKYSKETAKMLKRIVLECLTDLPEVRPKASDICIREETNRMLQHLKTNCDEGKSSCVLGNKNEPVRQNAYDIDAHVSNSGSDEEFNGNLSCEEYEPSSNDVEYELCGPVISINDGSEEEFNGDLSCEEYEPGSNDVENEFDSYGPSVSNSGSDEETFNGDMSCEEYEPGSSDVENELDAYGPSVSNSGSDEETFKGDLSCEEYEPSSNDAENEFDNFFLHLLF